MASWSVDTLTRLVAQDPSFAVCSVHGKGDKENAAPHGSSVTVLGSILQFVHEDGSGRTCTFGGSNDSLKRAFLLHDVSYVVSVKATASRFLKL